MNNLEEKCKKVLSGELNVDEFFKDCHTRRSIQELYSLTSDLDIPITPEDVISYLNAFINDKKSAEEAAEWALFIIMSGAYNRNSDNKPEDYYDHMGFIIEQMSCPAIDGVLTKERARGYIAELKKL